MDTFVFNWDSVFFFRMPTDLDNKVCLQIVVCVQYTIVLTKIYLSLRLALVCVEERAS